MKLHSPSTCGPPTRSPRKRFSRITSRDISTPLAAEARAQHVEHRLAQRVRHFLEAQPVILDIELGVLPAPPLLRHDREARLRALLGREPASEAPSPPRSSPSAGAPLGPSAKRPGDDDAVGGDAAERLVELCLPRRRHRLAARAAAPRLRVGARGGAGDLVLRRRRQDRGGSRTCSSAQSAQKRARFPVGAYPAIIAPCSDTHTSPLVAKARALGPLFRAEAPKHEREGGSPTSRSPR